MPKTKFQAFLEGEATLDGSIIIKGKVSNASDNEKKAVGGNTANLLKVYYANREDDNKSNHILVRNNSNNVTSLSVDNSFIKLVAGANVFVESAGSQSNNLSYIGISLDDFKTLPDLDCKRPDSQGTQSIVGGDWGLFCN
jgi:hypothetical protein